MINKTKKECWINDDPLVKKFCRLAKDYYKGTFSFDKSGKQYVAKLDPTKLKIDGANGCCEAYFEITRPKKTNTKSKDIFFLRLVDNNKDENVIKIL
jgi:FlaG/FlaF family flagellin (archaellin)